MRLASMTSRVAAFVLSLLPIFGCFAQTPFATNLPTVSNTQILPLGTYEYVPSVMADGALYKIWFCTSGVNPTGDHIFYSESNNLDSGWGSLHDVFQGTGSTNALDNPNSSDFDRTHTCDPSVIRVDGTYYMYYGGNWANAQLDGSVGRTAIGVASSPDGMVWTRMNNGKPIVTPKIVVDGQYGAGQPSVFYRQGLFYMLYTDTTATSPVPSNIGPVFVLRSSDPTFQTYVDELQGPGNWVRLTGTPPAPARTWSPPFPGGVSLDWRYDDALGRVAVAISINGGTDINILWYDIDNPNNPTYSFDIPAIWTEGPGLVHRPDGHAPTSAPSTLSWVPVDVMRSTVLTPAPPGQKGSPTGLAHARFDYQTPNAKSTLTLSVSSSIPNYIARTTDTIAFTANFQLQPGQPAATGTVTFYDGGVQLGNGSGIPIVGGSAQLATSLSAGDHSISASYSGDANYSPASSPSIWQGIGQTGRLINLSTRARVMAFSSNDGQVIGGLVIGGSTPKTVAIVATGPSLAAFGVASPLTNPRFTIVHSPDGAFVASNDNWQSDPNQAQLQASGFAPTNPWEAGLLLTLPPGAYTAIVDGAPTGTTVLAAWDVGQPQSPFANLSTRAWVGTGDDVAVGGFIVADAPRTVLITATGPSLAPFQIPNYLPNPKITLVRQSDRVILATNDEWMSGPDAGRIQLLLPQFGLTLNAHESALLATNLAPGAYTVILEGVNNSTGIGVLGLWSLPFGS